jgi:hypothetical protein
MTEQIGQRQYGAQTEALQGLAVRRGAPSERPAAAAVGPPYYDMSSLNAHGGEVIASARLFAVYWGRHWGDPNQGLNQAARDMNSYLSELVSGRYMDMLGSYGVGRGELIGSAWIDHDPASSDDYNEITLTNLLSSWLDQNLLPIKPGIPDELSLLFMIFASDETTVNMLGNHDICGFHYFAWYGKVPLVGRANLFYAVVETAGGYDPKVTASHELVEAVTDRSGNGWRTEEIVPAIVEIADACNNCGDEMLHLPDGSWVASYWVIPPGGQPGGHCLSQDELTPLDRVNAVLIPDQFQVNTPQTFTITVTDAVTGNPVPDVVVTVHNFSPSGNPVSFDLPQAASPVTATVTFHLGRRVDPVTHRPVFDLIPTLNVQAQGYTGEELVPNFPNVV